MQIDTPHATPGVELKFRVTDADAGRAVASALRAEASTAAEDADRTLLTDVAEQIEGQVGFTIVAREVSGANDWRKTINERCS